MREAKNFFSKGQVLPIIRITKAVLDNFKNVEHGEITFYCGKQFVPYNTESDILGIYGQNGSGKTAFIEALAILQDLMSGKKLSDKFVDCIALGKDFAKLEFTFELQYPDKNKTVRTAIYSFCLKAQKKNDTKNEIESNIFNNINTNEISSEESYDHFEGILDTKNADKVLVFNEVLYLVDSSPKKKQKKQKIIDTSSTLVPFIPHTQRKKLAGQKSDSVLDLAKRFASENSMSFIFFHETLAIFEKKQKKQIALEVLAELRFYAKYYIYVVSTRSSGLIRLNVVLPLYTRFGEIPIKLDKPMNFPKPILEILKKCVHNINIVLEQLIPGLTIDVKELKETLIKIKHEKKPVKAVSAMLVTRKGDIELPLRYESDGIKKTISILNLIITVFNSKSFTLAIDEFDAGIFEYLLGEILQVMEEYGKGQFIFTSHNLRPLEVINRKFLCFTTTDPKERYVRLKKIAETNNLRDTYFRKIMFADPDQALYKGTKQFKIIEALSKADEGE